MDCFNCTEKDCVKDSITSEERRLSNEHDTEIRSERKYGKDTPIWKYNHSEKGKAKNKKYWASDKGKATHKRYMESEKGKATVKRQQQRRIESGKNAEYCRAYYQRQKQKRIMELMKGGAE